MNACRCGLSWAYISCYAEQRESDLGFWTGGGGGGGVGSKVWEDDWKKWDTQELFINICHADLSSDSFGKFLKSLVRGLRSSSSCYWRGGPLYNLIFF